MLTARYSHVRARAVAVLTFGCCVLTTALTTSPAAATLCLRRANPYSTGVVFVGTVTAVQRIATATVSVEDVWRGGRLPSTVTVDGDSQGPGMAQFQLDRGFEIGERYTFAPHDDSPPFQDGYCSATERYDDVAHLRPPGHPDLSNPATLRDRPAVQAYVGAPSAPTAQAPSPSRSGIPIAPYVVSSLLAVGFVAGAFGFHCHRRHHR